MPSITTQQGPTRGDIAKQICCTVWRAIFDQHLNKPLIVAVWWRCNRKEPRVAVPHFDLQKLPCSLVPMSQAANIDDKLLELQQKHT